MVGLALSLMPARLWNNCGLFCARYQEEISEQQSSPTLSSLDEITNNAGSNSPCLPSSAQKFDAIIDLLLTDSFGTQFEGH